MLPYHVFIQQFLTLVLQNSNFTKFDWPLWIGKVTAFAEFQDGRADAIISYATEQNLIGEDGGRLHLGAEADRRLGYKHFSELLSVVTSQPLFQVRYGRQEIGFVHPLSFATAKVGSVNLSLGGRGWKLLHVDWTHKIAYVEPSQESGRSRWMGSSLPLSQTLCSIIRDILTSAEQDPMWSRRALDRISQMRQDFPLHFDDEYVIIRNGKSLKWWTFAGLIVNQTVVQYLQPYFESPLRADNLWIKLPPETTMEQLEYATAEVISDDDLPDWEFQQPAADLLKFGDLLPNHLLNELILARIADVPRARELLGSFKRIF